MTTIQLIILTMSLIILIIIGFISINISRKKEKHNLRIFAYMSIPPLGFVLIGCVFELWDRLLKYTI